MLSMTFLLSRSFLHIKFSTSNIFYKRITTGGLTGGHTLLYRREEASNNVLVLLQLSPLPSLHQRGRKKPSENAVAHCSATGGYRVCLPVFGCVRASGMVRSRVPSRPAGRDPGRDGTGFFKGIFEKTRPTEDF